MSNKRGETKTKSNRNPNTTTTKASTKASSTKLPLMRSYARIKPASADKKGGINAKQSISEWDGASGTVTFHPSVEGVKNKSVRFEHFLHCIAPTDTQEHTYLIMCSPLVSLWLDGYDCDVICYGQTGSGKTYTQFGPPHSMQEALSNLGESGGKGTLSSQSIMEEHHGFILRTGFAAFETVQRINANNDGSLALLHGSMVEMSILQKSQNAGDLLNHKKSCFVDKDKHLEGAVHRPLLDARDLIELAAAVETRLSRGTKMNNSSSRSHCITVFTLHVRDPNNCVRVSRFNFFDFMGSERFSGANSAHNSGQSARSTTAGWEGIFANYSLLFLGEAVRAAANARRKKKGTIQKMGGQGFLNELLGTFCCAFLGGVYETTILWCLFFN